MTIEPGQRIVFKETYLSPIWAQEIIKGTRGIISGIQKNEEFRPSGGPPRIEVRLDEPFPANGASVQAIQFIRGLGGDGHPSYEDVQKIFAYYCALEISIESA